MNAELIDSFQYSITGRQEGYHLPFVLKDSLRLISNYFTNNSNHKLCLVFPTKEFAAQWLSIPTVLFLIESDFVHFKNEITIFLESCKKGDWIILNNEAVVEWIGRNEDGFIFKHREYNGVDEITISIKKISKIQPAPSNRKALSGYKRVLKALARSNENPVDKILGIQTEGNKLFQKNSICLISKYISFENSISEISINNFLIDEYFEKAKIDDNGMVDMKSPLLISNNLTNLALYVTLSDTVSKLIIDGYTPIHERGGDFIDIDVKEIPTILITDLSEIESFENIGKYGFDFFNFTKENLRLSEIKELSPFNSFNEKLKKYVSFKLQKEICNNAELEKSTQFIHSIEQDDSVKELVTMKILLIQFTNLISRIAHSLSQNEVSQYKEMLSNLESNFFENRFYLGDSVKAIQDSIFILKSVLEKFTNTPSEKCSRLHDLMKTTQYDYIICTTDDEAQTLASYFKSYPIYANTKVISVGDLNNNILQNKTVKAILTGWPKANNVNRILSSFLFSELTVLFYEFEYKYFNSLQSRNKRITNNIKSTVNNEGILTEKESETESGFADLYKSETTHEQTSESNFDIADFELILDSAVYSKYRMVDNTVESIKAKRIDFENGYFIYSTSSHKFLVINQLVQSDKGERANLYRRKIDLLQTGDVIALINTERDILVELVEKNTNTKELASVKQWIELWKDLLKVYYASIGNDINKLVEDLSKNDCKKHKETIKAWLHDETRIGPDDNADLISIALLTNSNLLNDNIDKVREAISKMTGWRMKASDFISDKIKSQIHEFADSSIINKKILVEGLGSVMVLKVLEVSNVWEDIDVKYINKILQKEII